jgi:hypothetical protein
MKNSIRFAKGSCSKSLFGAVILCFGLSGARLLAIDAASKTAATTSTASEETDYKNWVNLTIGGVSVSGNEAQFSHDHGKTSGIYGGIEDSHFEQSVGKRGLFTLDARAIWDDHDYKIRMELSQPDVGYIRAGYTQFRTYTNANGGYFPAVGTIYPNGQNFGSLVNNELALDRGNAWIELGLRVPDLPEVTFRYEHSYRNGEKDSTSWGSSYLTGVNSTVTNAANQRKIVPSFRDINEKRDTFTLDIKKTLGNTEVNLGMRYERIDNNDSLYERTRPGEASTVSTGKLITTATDTYITQNETQKTDSFSGHFSTVTRFNDKIWLTLGYSYTTDSDETGGGRIVSYAYNTPFITLYNNTQYSSTSEFLKLAGGSQVDQHVGTLSLMWMPFESLSIIPSIRVEGNDTNSESTYNTAIGATETSKKVKVGKVTTTVYSISIPAQEVGTRSRLLSSDTYMNIAESLDIRYTGLTDWVLYFKGDWESEKESTADSGRRYTISTVSGATTTKSNLYSKDSIYTRFNQKYAVGANWYPLPRLNFALQYYHKFEDLTQDFHYDDPTTAPDSLTNTTFNQRLVGQKWNTDDVNLRITLRPLSNLSLVTRYDLQYTKIDSQWKQTSDGTLYNDGLSGEYTNHMFTEGITWTPLDRLYLQANASYVLNQTKTPAADLSTAVLNFHNDYWTLSFGAGFAIDDKTQLRADYSFYRANDYVNNATTGMPYGSGALEHSVSASISRQITKNVQVVLKYGFYSYKDQLYNGLNDYKAHQISSTIQVRF